MEGDDMSIRVASFAYYLDSAKDNFMQRVSTHESPILIHTTQNKSATSKSPLNFSVFKVPGPVPDPTTGFSFSRDIMQKDAEISVFGADKYFNMKMEYQTGLKSQGFHKNQGPTTLGSNIGPTTPSLCSEASSSLNSQSALLLNLNRTESKKKGFFTRFRCQALCFNKKAVRITELPPHLKDEPSRQGVSYDSKATRLGSEKINHLSVLIPGTEKSVKTEAEALEDSRNSIEVFGSATKTKGSNIATNLERKLSMLTWDAIPKVKTIPTCTTCDDMASEASSDLFEIENISGNLHPFSTTDDMSSCLSPLSHYAPSEASIQWSVVTASAADYAYVPSDYYDDSVSVAAQRHNEMTKNLKIRNVVAKETVKSPRGRLLGCNSLKSVNVAENNHKVNEKVKHQGVDLLW